MSIEFLTAKANCVVWKNIHLPHLNKSVKSPVFCFNGSELYFEIMCTCSYTPSEVYHHEEQLEIRCYKSDHSRVNLTISPYVETPTKYDRIVKDIKEKFRRSSLFQYSNNSSNSNNDVVTVLFLFASASFSIPLDFIETEENDSEKELKEQFLCLEGLSKDIGKLFNKDEHADVTLKCGETSFSVHKYILTARSEVFSAMFQHEMAEKNSGMVNIVDLDSDILELFLRFLYSGKVEEMFIDTALELYQTATKYSVNTLKQYCASYILKNMSKDNVPDVLILADKADDIEFLDNVSSFATNIEGFLSSPEWKDFAERFPKLGVKVYLKYHSKHM